MTMHHVKATATQTWVRTVEIDIEIPDDIDEIAASDLIDEALWRVDLNACPLDTSDTSFEFETPNDGRPMPTWL